MPVVNLTGSGAAFDATAPKFGTAALSAGSGSAAGLITKSTGYTVEAWGCLSTTGSVFVLFGQRELFWVGVTASGCPTAHYGAPAGEAVITGATSVADGAWHLFSFQVDNSGVGSFYLDGALVGTGAANATGNPASYPFGVRTFGGYPDFGWPGKVQEAVIFSGARYTGSFKAPSAPYLGNEAGLAHLYHLSGDLTDSFGASTTALPNDTGILYSPANWDVTASRAFTINAGARFRALFTGSSIALTFDVSSLVAPFPQIAWRVDGYGPRTVVPLASTVVLAIPADTAGYARHLLDVRVKSTSETLARWPGAQTGVRLTGIKLDPGASLSRPGTAARTILAYGDSITEGVRTVNATAPSDTDRNDADQGWAADLGPLLGAEVGVIGFGGSGLTVTGSGGVPPLPQTYNLIAAGIPRTFPSNLDAVVINIGTNDGSADTSAAMTATLNGLLGAIPSKASIFILRPFKDATQSNFLKAAIAACTAPGRCTFIDTAGFFTGNSSDGLHPYGSEDLGMIGPRVASALAPYLAAPSTAVVVSGPTFRRGFR